MSLPMILKKDNKKYILEKVYKNYALYSDLEYGIKECFTFHELGIVEQVVEPEKYKLSPENVNIF